ncbi:TBC1 domain family member 5 [Halotydeus destructor]|nr:TBC1 domain family member 5 [Halotydeus destructor]
MATVQLDDYEPVDDAEEPFENLCSSDEIVNETLPEEPANLNQYRIEFENLFGQINWEQLKRHSVAGGLRNCRFRSVCWRIFLECLPEDRVGWKEVLQSQRADFDDLKAKYSPGPRDAATNLVVNNPLSQEEASPWNQFFQDNELQTMIRQDVVRTFPEISFFSEPEVQTSLSNILFYYAKEFPSVSYRQGMHEILAPLFFVVYSDQQACIHAGDIGMLSAQHELENNIENVLDPKYLEHDTYFLFKQVMETLEPWYSQEPIVAKGDSMNFEPFMNGFEPSSCSVLGVKLKMIFEQILRKRDVELFNFLHGLQVTPQIFGIRWMRLLFGREFSMQDLLVIWDAVFADSISFSLCDYIFVSMLIVIRKLLLASDYTQCMGYLMKYPNISDVHYIIDLALHLKDPLNYNEPSSHSLLVLPNSTNPTGNPRFRREHLILGPVSPSGQAVAANTPKSVVRSQTFDGISSVDSKTSSRHSGQSSSRSRSFNGPNGDLDKGVAREMKTIQVVTLNEITDSKIDYCWKHLTSQIETLQRCLSVESGLKNEDQLFVALAELKKVRDILKGSLKMTEK